MNTKQESGGGVKFNRNFWINVVEIIKRQIRRNNSLVPKIILWINTADYAREFSKLTNTLIQQTNPELNSTALDVTFLLRAPDYSVRVE